MGTSQFEEEFSSQNNLRKVYTLGNKDEDYKQIELLPIFNKISLVQALLKEMLSIKERFEENKDKMLEKIQFYCFKYYKRLVLSKEIYDNCNFKNDLSEHKTYILNSNASKSIEKNMYRTIYNFLFFLRNNNKYMLKIIDSCHKVYKEKLSHFIAHFFYENTINNKNSFVQEELQLIIYLLIEKLINQNYEDILNYNSDIFLYSLISSLTLKPDIRNFLNILLSDLIIQIENGKHDFIIELVKREKNCPTKNIKKTLRSFKTEVHFLKKNISIQKKGTIDGTKHEIKNINKAQELLNRANDIKANYNSELNDKEASKERKDNNMEELDSNEIKKRFQNRITHDFYIENDVDFKYIFEKLTNHENLKEKNKISLAMIYFLGNHFTQLTSKIKGQEKFRNTFYFSIINEKKNDKEIEENEKYLLNTKKKYELVTYFISNIIKKLEESISSIPKAIKNLSYVLDALIEKKMMKKEKFQKIEYCKIMVKLKILIGNMLIPTLKQYELNKIISDHILMRPTVEILKTTQKILNAMILGHLFDNETEPEYTIYNKFIIDKFPNLMKISLILDSSINDNNPDKFSSAIIEKLIDSLETKDNKRIINYDELIDLNHSSNNNIMYQSICFNWEILYILVKTIEKERDFFINKKNNPGVNKIFEDSLKLNKDLFILSKSNQVKKEFDYFFLDKIIYKDKFNQKINVILQDNFKAALSDEENKEVGMFKKCLCEVLGYVGVLHKEDFAAFITPKKGIKVCSNNQTNLYYYYKKKKLYKNTEFESDGKDNKNKEIKDDNNDKQSDSDSEKYHFNFKDRDKFFTRRKSVMFRWLEIGKEKNYNTDFHSCLFPQIVNIVKTEIGNYSQTEKSQRILFCCTYVLTHFNNLPLEYRKNNYSKIFIEIIKDTKILIDELEKDIVNEFFKAIRYTEGLNEIVNRDFIQNKNMEKVFFIKHLYKQIKVNGYVVIEKNKNNIEKIKFETKESKMESINFFVRQIPNIVELDSKKKEDILSHEKNIGLNDTINEYFKELKKSIKNQEIMSKLSVEEFLQVIYGIENYILRKLYHLCYPIKQSKEDLFIYKKCIRLYFIKPHNIIKDKKFKNINEKLLDISIDYIKEMDNKNSPMDKINSFGKALNFLSNSMEFNSGKEDFGVDDLLPLLIYIVIKSRPQKLQSNYSYCMNFINKDLLKKQYGSLLTQIGVIKDIIKNMKYNELNDVSEEQFGVDEEV